MMHDSPYHIPALLTQAIDALDIKPSGTYVDVTFGGGGHSRAILAALDDKGRLFAFDRDSDALANVPDDSRFTFVRSNFRWLANFMRFHGVDHVDGILADLGVSFHHFDVAPRGFSFRADGPLDMRMNRRSPLTAADLIATASPADLASWLRLYGELPQAKRIADAIVKARAAEPVTTVGALLSAVEPLLNPKRAKKELACIFQALRIVVNDEMGALKDLLNASLTVTRPGSRLAVITYHSLEDRMVKNFMRTGNVEGLAETDIFGRKPSPWRLVTPRPITPDEAEVSANPRSRSAKLRVAERL